MFVCFLIRLLLCPFLVGLVCHVSCVAYAIVDMLDCDIHDCIAVNFRCRGHRGWWTEEGFSYEGSMHDEVEDAVGLYNVYLFATTVSTQINGICLGMLSDTVEDLTTSGRYNWA